MTRLLLPTLLAVACTTPALAQTPFSLRPGAEVRVKSPTASGRFVVAELSSEVLTLRDASGAVVLVPMESVSRLSVSHGPRSKGAGALRGAGLGFAGGAGAGILLGFAEGDDPPEYFFSFTAEEKAVMYGIILGGAAGIVGGVIGLAAPGERWESVPLDGVRAGLASDGGLAVGYSIRF